MPDLIFRPSQSPGVAGRDDSNIAYQHNRDARGRATWIRGTVKQPRADTYTIDVETDDGRYYPSVPLLVDLSTPGKMAGKMCLPQAGSRVVVSFDMGIDEPVIVGCLTADTTRLKTKTGTEDEIKVEEDRALTGLNLTSINPGEMTGGANDPYHANQGETNARGYRPDDCVPGDWGFMNDEGAGVAVLEGGGVVAKAGDMSQIVMTKLNDLIRLVSRNLEIFNDFGEISFKNEEGTTYFEMKGGRSLDETLNERYTFKLRAGGGAEPFKLAVTDGSNFEVASLKVNAAGEIIISGTDVIIQGTKDHEPKTGYPKTIKPAENIQVNSTSISHFKNDITRTVEGSVKDDINLNLQQTVGRNRSIEVMGEDSVAANYKRTVNVAGDKLNLPGATVLEYIIGSGSVSWDIGNYMNAVIPFMQRGWAVQTYFGDIEHNVQLDGSCKMKAGYLNGDIKCEVWSPISKIILQSLTPNSTILGGLIPIWHIPRFEILSMYLTALMTFMDTHTHISPIGPTTPPLIPVTPILGSLIPLMSSLNVAFML